MTRALNLTNCVFGRLTAINLEVSYGRRKWFCNCECGNTKLVAQKELVAGDTKSCGCIKKEMVSNRNKFGKVDHAKLDEGGKKAYAKWASMWSRVRHPKGKSSCYKDVKIDDTWKNFHKFYEDMGDPPEGLSLDRVNNDGGYGPENCRWVPLAHQARNTSRNRFIEIGGVVKTMSEHARDWGITPDLVHDRISKLKWDVVAAVTTPKMSQGAGVKRKPTTNLNSGVDRVNN